MKRLFLILTSIIILLSFNESKSIEFNGREFIATFIPNYHNYWFSSDPKLKYGDSVYFFIYTQNKNTVFIDYHDRFDNHYIDTINLAPNELYTFKKVSYDFALLGFKLRQTNDLNFRYNSEVISNVSFRIKSEEPIIIVGHSQAVMSSESFNVMPVEHLGNEYIISSFNSNVNTPSQFAIVANEDNTQIEIVPSAPTRFNQLKKQNITLQKDEVYLVQANVITFDNNYDLTGTLVTSNKPIAVFSGHQRSMIPLNNSALNPSRDYLVEQLIPIDMWSSFYIAVPFPKPTLEANQLNTDLIRIMAATDNTDIKINGQFVININKGQFYETNFNKTMIIEANSGVLVTAFKKSSTFNSNIDNDIKIGDPLMQILPSIEQFGNRYNFINIQAWEYNTDFFRYQKVYTEHYISLIATSNSINNIFLDNNLIDSKIFTIIPNTDFYWGVLKVSEGAHEIWSNDNFGVCVVGYGSANSYGYFTASFYKRYDYSPPKYFAENNCFSSKINIVDQFLKEVNIDSSKLVNTDIIIPQFNPYIQSLDINAKLINNKLDGFALIYASDSSGQISYKEIEIPGFTVGLTQASDIQSINPFLIESGIPNSGNLCFDFTIKNYGKYPQIINKSNFKINKNLQSNLPQIFTLEPNQSIDFQICLNDDFEKNIEALIDTFYIENECFYQEMVIIDLIKLIDKNPPILTSSKDLCNQSISLFVSDSLRSDLGIKEIKFNNVQNLSYTINDIDRYRKFINFKITDPYEDSYFDITITDSVGNIVNYKDTIPGFTLSFAQLLDYKSNNLEIDLGNKQIGNQYLDTFILRNYGDFPLILDNIYFKNNIYYSIPVNQLPLVIKPGEYKPMIIYVKPMNSIQNPLNDTLIIENNCLTKSAIYTLIPDSLITSNNSKCDVYLILSTNQLEVLKTNVSNIIPNPSKDKISFTIDNPQAGIIKGEIYNTNGLKVLEYLNEHFEKSSIGIEVDISRLSSGLYFNIIYLNGEIIKREFLIEK